MIEEVLAGYGEYVRVRRLASENRVRYYVEWVRRFLAFAVGHGGGSFDLCLLRFLETLRQTPGRPDWQIGQAKDALHIYYYQYRHGGSERSTGVGEASALESPCVADRLVRRPGRVWGVSGELAREAARAVDGSGLAGVVSAMTEVLRLRHYRYRTEQRYLDWGRRFYGFVHETRGEGVVPGVEDVRNYLTHLVLDRHVSSSTQNQAFNALLFLCREVIGVDLEDMDKTVRAKRGAKLPVVLSVAEVREVVGRTSSEHRLAVKLIYGPWTMDLQKPTQDARATANRAFSILTTASPSGFRVFRGL